MLEYNTMSSNTWTSASHFWKQVCIHAPADEWTQMAGKAAEDRLVFIICWPGANGCFGCCWIIFNRDFFLFRKRCGDDVWKKQSGRQQAICQGELYDRCLLVVIWTGKFWHVSISKPEVLVYCYNFYICSIVVSIFDLCKKSSNEEHLLEFYF